MTGVEVLRCKGMAVKDNLLWGSACMREKEKLKCMLAMQSHSSLSY